LLLGVKRGLIVPIVPIVPIVVADEIKPSLLVTVSMMLYVPAIE
jgi:hypothetical protein